MCGIAGIFDPRRRLGPSRLGEVAAAMAAHLIHRGPDDHGTWVSDDGLCALAHRRLAIIDASVAGRQPMRDAPGRHVISFNGEIYNYRELREELSRRGRRFSTQSDTEVLIESFAEFGDAVYEKLEGMYAFAVFDSTRRHLTLARDPFGEKPLYYTSQDGAIAFASELGALHAVPWFDPDVRIEAIAGYLALQYVQSPATIYRDTFKVDPGAWLDVDEDGRLRHGRHFDFDPDGASHSDDGTVDLDELDAAVTQAVGRCLVSDFPLGTFLSSGVDSSLVTAVARRLSGAPLRTFAIGFDASQESEEEAARDTARFLDCHHTSQTLSPQALDHLPAIAAAMDEPNGDSSCLPTFLLSALARRDVKVALSGDGGDELFGGYETYGALARGRREGAKASAGVSTGAAYVRMMMTFSREEVAQLVGGLPRETADLLASLAAIVDREDRPLISRLRLADAQSFLPGSVLAKVDRMSMRHSLEVRCPLLQRSVARLAVRLRPNDCLSETEGKVLLRRLARRYLPPRWMNRPKRGFAFPTDWPLADALLQLFADHVGSHARLHTWVSSRTLEQFLDRQRRSARPNVSQLWRLLVLELWLQSHAQARMAPDGSGEVAIGLPSPIDDELILESLTPSGTRAGEAFNAQPDGSSALAVSCAHAGPWTTIIVDDEELQTTFGDAHLLTAIVPEAIYSRPGQHRVRLADGDRVSNTLEFSVHPSADTGPLVSVVIPCFNQGRFLAESVASALAQTSVRVEVIVVDDGSTDETADVAARFPSVRYVRQGNRGLAAARNRGLEESRGEFVIFLDADDRLLPTAAELGVRSLRESADAAFAFGHYRSITERGAVLIEAAPRELGEDAYCSFLRGNLVGTTASAIFRTSVLRQAGGFDGSTRYWGCEDYELYLRLARQSTVTRYHEVVAEYRHHRGSMSRDALRMLSSLMAVLDAQRDAVRGTPPRRSALAEGRRAWRNSYVPSVLVDLVARRQSAIRILRRILALGRLAPREVVSWGSRVRWTRRTMFRVHEAGQDPWPVTDARISQDSGIRLLPSATSAGEHFNLQPCGMSALAVECSDAQPESTVVFGETPLLTTHGGPTLLTALVPEELYAEPCECRVYVVSYR
jgi:asparagine synthase (glutamine-hydrolysing)